MEIKEEDIKQVLAMFDEEDLKYVDLEEVYKEYYKRKNISKNENTKVMKLEKNNKTKK